MTTYTRAAAKGLIENPNTSGQGHCPMFATHAFREAVEKRGYRYSHSVPVGASQPDDYRIAHCFRFPGSEHSVTLWEGSRIWSTKTSPASGHSWDGLGLPELEAHLKSKARRHDLTLKKHP